MCKHAFLKAKAFVRQTSALHYLVSIVLQNDKDVMRVSEDFIPVRAAERVSMESLNKELKEMGKGIVVVKDVVKRYLPESVVPSNETPQDKLLGATPMGRFSLTAASTIQSISNEFADAKSNYADIAQFFGKNKPITPEAFFNTINTSISMFEQTHKEIKRKKDSKMCDFLVFFCAMLDAVPHLLCSLTFCVHLLNFLQEHKKKIDEKRKLREQELEAKKIRL